MDANTNEVTYKGITFNRSEQFNYLELVVDEKIHNEVSFILSITTITEYCEKISPKYLIINRLNSSFVLTETLYRFTENHINVHLRSSGVEKVIMLVNDGFHEMNFVEPDKESFYISFRSREDCRDWIIEQN